MIQKHGQVTYCPSQVLPLSAVFLFESKKAGRYSRYSFIKKKGKHERISTVTVFSGPQNTPTAGYQGVFPHLFTKEHTKLVFASISMCHVVPFGLLGDSSLYTKRPNKKRTAWRAGPPFSTPQMFDPLNMAMFNRVVKSAVFHFSMKKMVKQKTWSFFGSGFLQQTRRMTDANPLPWCIGSKGRFNITRSSGWPILPKLMVRA